MVFRIYMSCYLAIKRLCLNLFTSYLTVDSLNGWSILLRACGFGLHWRHPQGYLACLVLKRDLNGARCKPPTSKPNIKFLKKYIYMGLGGLFLAGVGFVLYNNFGGLESLIPPPLVSTEYGPVDCPCHKEATTEAKEHLYIPVDDTLPLFTPEQLRKHTTAQSKIWISLDKGVFDITDYIEQHPEESKILTMAAGGPLDPFLHIYPIYKEPQVLDLLTKHRIGNLTVEDAKQIDPNDPFSHEPKRHPAMKVVMDKPFNAEPPADILAEHYITPNELFFVRNNLPLPPPVDEKIHKVQILGKGLKTLNIPLNDIKTKFKKYVVTSTIQCVGLRRKEMSQHKPTESVQWDQGCIGTANWGGTRLCEFLEAAGFKKENSNVKHVIFEGLDSNSKNVNYCTSIPIERALDPDCDVLLAYEMNGKPLSRDHGHPLRVIVPGVAGARQVKYLAKITLSEKEPNSQWQQLHNKAFPPGMDATNLDTTSMPAIQEMPVTSAITNLMEGDTIKLHGGKIYIKGYAYSGGGSPILRVDASSDGGKTWHTANISYHHKEKKYPHHWTWSLWDIKLPVLVGAKEVDIWIKAVDSSYQTQPETVGHIWNIGGNLNNSYHKVKVKIEA